MIVQVITVRLIQTQNHGNLRPADGAPTVGGEIWCSFLSTYAFLLGNGQTFATRGVPYYRVSISHFRVSHFPPLQHGAAFSCPAISCLAFSASPLRSVFLMHCSCLLRVDDSIYIFIIGSNTAVVGSR